MWLPNYNPFLWQFYKSSVHRDCKCMLMPSFFLAVRLTPYSQNDPPQMRKWWLFFWEIERDRKRNRDREREALDYTLETPGDGCACSEIRPASATAGLSWCHLHIRLMYKLLFKLRLQKIKSMTKSIKTTFYHITVGKINFWCHVSLLPSFYVLIFLIFIPINQASVASF